MRIGILKRLAFMAIIGATFSNAYATAAGFYLGLMLGPATNGGGQLQVQTQAGLGLPQTTVATPKSKQFATRLFMGYQFNPFAGMEFGLDYFTGIGYDTKNVPTCSSTQVRIRGFDLVGKGDIPFRDYFDIYGKAGAALIYQTTSGDLNTNFNQPCGKSTYITQVRPTVSIGASYYITQSVVTDVSLNRIMVGGPASSVDYFAIGISYHFVDRYCGQFLCDD